MIDNQMNDSNDNTVKRTPIEYLSVTEAEKLTGISNSTIKRYLVNHDSFVHYIKQGREYRISLDSIEVLKKISNLYDEGHRKDRVNALLESDGYPVTFTVANSSDTGMNLETVNQDIKEIANMAKLVMKQNKELIEQVSYLKTEAKETNERINNSVNKTDLLLKEIEELKEELKEDRNNKGNWFTKLFRKDK